MQFQSFMCFLAFRYDVTIFQMLQVFVLKSNKVVTIKDTAYQKMNLFL